MDEGTNMNRLAFLLLLVAGCKVNFDPPIVNPPATSISQAASDGFTAYRLGLSSAFNTLASEIEQGAIEDDEDLANRMEELTKEARLKAFEPFREEWNKQAGPDSEWEHQQRAMLCREAAKGFR
jgi:hypothetical protein